MATSLPIIFGFIGIGSLGGFEMLIVAVVAVILFGAKLPEVARNVGQSYQQFRKGLADIQSSFTSEVDLSSPSTARLDDYSDVDDFDESDVPAMSPPPAED